MRETKPPFPTILPTIFATVFPTTSVLYSFSIRKEIHKNCIDFV